MIDDISTFFTENIIDVIALIISLLTFLYTCYLNKIKIEINEFYIHRPDSNKDLMNQYNLLFMCNIVNKCQYPITIQRVKFNKINSLGAKFSIKGGDIQKFGQEYIEEQCTLEFPLKLDMFDSKKDYILFTSYKPIKIRKINLIVFYTSRGKYYRIIFNPKII